jgi:predicted phage tail protein
MNVRRPGLRDKQALTVKAGGVTGSVVVVAKAAGDRATYEWQYSKVGEPWIDVEPTRQARKAFSGLAAGGRYRFRVRSVTQAGRSDFGAVVSGLVT